MSDTVPSGGTATRNTTPTPRKLESIICNMKFSIDDDDFEELPVDFELSQHYKAITFDDEDDGGQFVISDAEFASGKLSRQNSIRVYRTLSRRKRTDFSAPSVVQQSQPQPSQGLFDSVIGDHIFREVMTISTEEPFNLVR